MDPRPSSDPATPGNPPPDGSGLAVRADAVPEAEPGPGTSRYDANVQLIARRLADEKRTSRKPRRWWGSKA